MPKVRNGIAWVFYRIAENAPELIFRSQETLNFYVNSLLPFIGDHFRVSLQIMSAFQQLFIKAAGYGATSMLEAHFPVIFQKIFECTYNQQFVEANEVGMVSQSINDITESMDCTNIKSLLNEIMLTILNLL